VRVVKVVVVSRIFRFEVFVVMDVVVKVVKMVVSVVVVKRVVKKHTFVEVILSVV